MLEYGEGCSEQDLADELAAVAALVFAMEQRGVLSKAAYGQALKRLWRGQPGEECIGDAGAVIERMFALQGHDIGIPATIN
jgi:hypothetical protein